MVWMAEWSKALRSGRSLQLYNSRRGFIPLLGVGSNPASD